MQGLNIIYKYFLAQSVKDTVRAAAAASAISTVRLLVSGGSFIVTHCHQKCVRKEISGSGFLDVNR